MLDINGNSVNPYDFNYACYMSQQTKNDVIHTCVKMYQYFSTHDKILISVSGGSDSDCIIHLICKYFPEYVCKCYFVFVDTGLEYNATKMHLAYLEKQYNITIEKIHEMSIVTAVKKYGVPILNKSRSNDIEYYLKGSQWAIDRIDGNIKKGTRYAYTKNMVDMIHHIKVSGIKISSKCCDKCKKDPILHYIKYKKIELNVTGERKAEGGQRSAAHTSCFEIHKDGMHKYMPLWWWDDYTKNDFKICENIKYSDCYEIWGMMRTGCCGCPFNLNIADDLTKIKKYEPTLYDACIKIFGTAYDLTDMFKCRRKKCMPD